MNLFSVNFHFTCPSFFGNKTSAQPLKVKGNEAIYEGVTLMTCQYFDFNVKEIQANFLQNCDIPSIKNMAQSCKYFNAIIIKSDFRVWRSVEKALGMPQSNIPTHQGVKEYALNLRSIFKSHSLSVKFVKKISPIVKSEQIQDIKRLNKILQAFEILSVWDQFAAEIDHGNGTIHSLHTVDDLFNKAQQFESWCEEHSSDLLKVKKINLCHLNLRVIPPQIKYLKGLESLSLKHNQLTNLPVEIGELTNLKILSLEHNQLTVLPSEIGNLISLKILSIKYNQLTELPTAIGSLTRLISFKILGNPLIELPQEIESCTQLKMIAFSKEILLPKVINSSNKWGLHRDENYQYLVRLG